MDEAQVVYHVDSFWRMFKAGSTCRVVAFAAFAVDDKRVAVKSKDAISPTPAVFADTRSYPFIAFTRDEFDEVARKFQAIWPNQFTDKVINFVAEQVVSSYQADQAYFYGDGEQPLADNSQLYHPGLAYACFELFSKFRGREDQVLANYGQGNNLYKALLSRVRCFARFRHFQELFERQVKMNAFENKENEAETQRKIASFESEFLSLIVLLCCDKQVEYNETNPSESNALKTVFVRHGFCCRAKPNNAGNLDTIHLSCPLVRTHFNSEVFLMPWSRATPPPYYDEETNLVKYAMGVVSSFSPKRLLENYQRGKTDQKVLEKGYQLEFGIVATRDNKAKVDNEHIFRNENGVMIGRVDFHLNGVHNIGVELVRVWGHVEDHVTRIDENQGYRTLSAYVTVHLHEGALPSEAEITTLIDTLKRRNSAYLDMLLIAHFLPNEQGQVDFNRVSFYIPDGDTYTLK
ncbi:hypothetical protein M569_17744 [Genlisea aurea]|uniref:Uncharacterized protein n=1 Tax=Genlisea aurea TaxID=192259 RepID=S8BY42_9LAMI|nr:hypothetical protein M569_17744 [Genlisea aurea]